MSAFFKIRFINSDGFVSWAIDTVTNSLWDHTEIETETGTWIGAHASGGVEERAADYCKPTRERRYAIPCTDEQLAAIMQYARSKIGTKYDFEDIAGLLFRTRKLHSKGRNICSAFVLMSAFAGQLFMLNIEPGYEYLCTPENLHLSPLLIGHCTYRFPEPK
jgi:hypothetical protein